MKKGLQSVLFSMLVGDKTDGGAADGRCAAAVRRMRQIGRHLHGGRLYGFR